ncbi:MAG: outer membrane protein transport protein [Acidobacteria bacterium]|nr:outer membrane protein transport protein [Acidobacteriota bacterium]
MRRGCARRVWSGFLGLAATGLAAQTLALPASDPTGIARGGAGVAFGRSLEAASLNPALLPTLEGRFAFYLAGGLELQDVQVTLQSNQRTLFGADRNRALPAFGAALKVSDRLSLGLKADMPFSRHVRLPLESTARFFGDRVELSAHRLELQAGIKVTERFSIGVGGGLARVSYTAGTTLRVQVPVDPAQPISASNPSQGLAEFGVLESGDKLAPSFSAGFRFAVNPRWTFGGAFQGPLRVEQNWKARLDDRPLVTLANDGYGTPPPQATASAAVLAGRVTPRPGTGEVLLPWRASLGLRQRVNQLLTWELDVRYTGSDQLKVPAQASLGTPSGTVYAPELAGRRKGSAGLSLMAEFSFGKNWTVRTAGTLDQPWVEENAISPMLSGGRTAGFSAGFGYRALGGEFLMGYQFRQTQDADSAYLDGAWSRTGFRTTGATTRYENMGHLVSVGFKKSF